MSLLELEAPELALRPSQARLMLPPILEIALAWHQIHARPSPSAAERQRLRRVMVARFDTVRALFDPRQSQFMCDHIQCLDRYRDWFTAQRRRLVVLPGHILCEDRLLVRTITYLRAVAARTE